MNTFKNKIKTRKNIKHIPNQDCTGAVRKAVSHMCHAQMLPTRLIKQQHGYKRSYSEQGEGVYQRNNCYLKPGHLVRKSYSILDGAHLALQDA